MMEKVTAVFDIGKTNKKFFLFNSDYQEVYREYSRFETITDEDNHPTEDLEVLQNWIKEVFDRMLSNKQYNITAINFSTYGASLVHLDETGKVLTPLYNYTKPLKKKVVADFYRKYGPEIDFSRATGSLNSGMLNAGMQLYWIKYSKPEVFKKIRYSLHLPQYLNYIFTGIPISEYTSIGCHTALWHYAKKDYHQWVYAEGLEKTLPPIVSTETSINMNYNGKRIKIGVGIHDSSAALIPYVRSVQKKFILVSTGTWSITLNPFSKGNLTKKEVEKECINYMRIDGKPVKSARLFLGNEYNLQVKNLSERFNAEADYHKTVQFDSDIYLRIKENFKPIFRWQSIVEDNMPLETNIPYDNFIEAYHHLMIEMVALQVKSIELAMGSEKIKRLYVDGGFSDNNLFIKMLSLSLPSMKLRTTSSSLGSALGAAIAISDDKLNSKFLKKNYTLTKHLPILFK
ncbi:FGGY-family carbohydrate kinase [Bacteroidota bacterium]